MTMHFEILVEEPSMEAFLQGLLPRLLPSDRTFVIHPFQGKEDSFTKLEGRLRAYAAWLPQEWRIVVVVDRDDDDCRTLKQRMEDIAARAGLKSRTRSPSAWQLVNRIAIEEADRRAIELLEEYRTRLIADVVTGKVDVREVAARLPEEPNEEDEPVQMETENQAETLQQEDVTALKEVLDD